MAERHRLALAALLGVAALLASGATLEAWGAQAHRVIAMVAWQHLSVPARRSVAALLGGASLPGVANWADGIRNEEPETSAWHFVNLRQGATRYDRDRDCPRPSDRADMDERDCVVDRILYFERQLADRRLGREARARALKFLVHFVADVHQPLHAIDVARGGNDIPVLVSGSAGCGPNGRGGERPCTLHGAWDASALGRRGLNDTTFVTRLESSIRANLWRAGPIAPDAWALESNRLAARLLVAPRTNLDDRYFRTFDRMLDEQLAKAGLRLAAIVNRAF